MSQKAEIDQARKWIVEAKAITVLTGAGISADSGVPTFRGDGGLWRKYRAEDLATPEAFADNPKLVWEWYDWRRRQLAGKRPNPGHIALTEMERRSSGFTLITQNVDGLHDLAGSRLPLKLHGDIWNLRCTDCSARSVNRETPLKRLPPLCDCGALLRPDIVWFGESLPQDVLEEAWSRACAADLFLVVGTSALVQPAASLPLLARERGARLVEINQQKTPLTAHADIALFGTAGDLLPALVTL